MCTLNYFLRVAFFFLPVINISYLSGIIFILKSNFKNWSAVSNNGHGQWHGTVLRSNSAVMRGEEQGRKSPFSLLSEPISPSSLLFELISPSSLTVYLTFSPYFSLLPTFLGHFSLFPILFLPLCNSELKNTTTTATKTSQICI